MKRVILMVGVIFCWVNIHVFSQQLPIYSQYTFNSFLLNPAAVGSEGYTAVNVTSRRQWNEISGAPEVDGISFQTRIYKRSYIRRNAPIKTRFISPLRNGKIGIGAYVFCDRSGPFNTTGTQFTYAYHITKSESQFSFGITTAIYQFSIDKNKLALADKNDNLLAGTKLKIIYPDFNIGTYFTNKTFFAGLSVLNISQANISFGSYKGEYKLYRLYSALGGVQIPVTSLFIYEPSFYLKLSHAGAIQAEVSQKIIISKVLWGGFSVRTGKTVVGFIGFKYNPIYFGYAFDYGYHINSMLSCGTHEFMLALKLGDSSRRYRWVERY